MAVVTVQEFLEYHPQFSQQGNAALAQALSDAMACVDESIFGALYNEAVRMKAAAILAKDMYSQQPAMKGDEPNPYEKRFKDILLTRGHRMTVA